MPTLHPDSTQALAAVRARAAGQRLVFVSGNFNVVHPGHLRLLRFAKGCGDLLVVGVLDRRSPGAVVDEALRLEGVRAIGFVDYAFLLHDAPADFIADLRPAVVVKGKEYESRPNPEAAAVAAYGGRLLFSSGDVSFSSLDLLRQELYAPTGSALVQPVDYPARHGFGHADLLALLRRLEPLRVCVIGDTIVDEYVTCEALGMSQEDPTIVVTPVATERFCGGAAIVAAHARSLGGRVRFFSVVGRDEPAEFARHTLADARVEAHLVEDDSRPTSLKQRFRAAGKTLLRVSHLRQHAIGADLRAALVADVRSALDDTDLVIFSDFNYGCLPQPVVDDLAAECHRRGIPMAADSQASSQLSDVSRFPHMTLITPTEREARLAVRDAESGLVVLAERLRQKSGARYVVVTLGAEGILVHADSIEHSSCPTDRLPAMNTAPRDVAGAGDSLLTAAAMGLAAGGDIWQSCYLGSLAAACQVARVGNVPLCVQDLVAELEPHGQQQGPRAEGRGGGTDAPAAHPVGSAGPAGPASPRPPARLPASPVLPRPGTGGHRMASTTRPVTPAAPGVAAVFLDRDGVLIEDSGLLTEAAAIRVLPGVPAALARLKRAGLRLLVVSNQAVVARGLLTEAQVLDLHREVERQLCAAGAPALDGFHFCPHHPHADLPAYRLDCDCRKPKPGLILRAAAEHGVDRRASFLVGDRVSDIVAGAAAGCRTVWVQTGQHTAPPIESSVPLTAAVAADFVCPSLTEAADWILTDLGRRVRSVAGAR